MAKMGRPKAFDNCLDLDGLIELYFESSVVEVNDLKLSDFIESDADGTPRFYKQNPITMSGLANFLGVDRKTIVNYTRDDDFFPTIKRARARVEEYVENYLFTGKNIAGAIFNLKNNFDWSDKHTLEHEAGDTLSTFLKEIDGKTRKLPKADG
jgi:hypothetical protein